MLRLGLVVAGFLPSAAALPLVHGGKGSLQRARPTIASLSVDEIFDVDHDDLRVDLMEGEQDGMEMMMQSRDEVQAAGAEALGNQNAVAIAAKGGGSCWSCDQ